MIKFNWRTLNWKVGFFRLWLLAAIIWAVAIAYNARDDISYDIRYATKYDEILNSLGQDQILRCASYAEAKASVPNIESAAFNTILAKRLHSTPEVVAKFPQEIKQRFAVEMESDYSYEAKTQNGNDAIIAKMKAEQSFRDACEREFDKTKRDDLERIMRSPNYDWILVLILPPTLGVLVLLGLLFGVYKVGRWVVSGFVPK